MGFGLTEQCSEDLTYLSVVQTGRPMQRLTGQWLLRRRSPSWCYLCTSPPQTCTGHPRWPTLEVQTAKWATTRTRRRFKQRKQPLIEDTYALRSTPRRCTRRRSLSPGPCRRRSRKHRSGWPRSRRGTSGCFSPTEMCPSSLTPSQSTHLDQRQTRILAQHVKVAWVSVIAVLFMENMHHLLISMDVASCGNSNCCCILPANPEQRTATAMAMNPTKGFCSIWKQGRVDINEKFDTSPSRGGEPAGTVNTLEILLP